MEKKKILAKDNAGHSATKLQNITNDLKEQGNEKTYKQKIMLDTEQPKQLDKTNNPKQHG